MKKIILLGFIFLPALTFAKPVQQDTYSVHEQNCRTIMEIAQVIMEKKQNGLPLSKALEENDDIFKKFIIKMWKGYITQLLVMLMSNQIIPHLQ